MKEKTGDFWENLNPLWGAIIFITIGFLVLLGAILNWNWVFEDDGRVFNIAWISNVFGRTVARILMGALGILISVGGIWFFFF
jgi:hypothetical protein